MNVLFNNPLDTYINNIEKYNVPIGKKQKLGIERYKKLKEDDRYYLDLEEVNKIIGITNELVLVKNGRIEKFKTRDFQNFILGNLVGWKVKKTKTRLYKEAYIQMARQNGKSLILSALAIYFTGFDKFINSRVFCTATKKEQAKIVWDNVKNFIEFNPILNKKYYKIQEHNTTITNLKKYNRILALSRDTKSIDGFDSCLGIVDEYHSHQSNQMYKLLFDGQVNVDNALTVAITTAGFDLNSACYQQYEYCDNILNGLVEKDSLFIFIAEPDEKDNIEDFKTWIKASPFLLLNSDYTINEKNKEKYENAVVDALNKQNEEMLNFKTKKLNIWVKYSQNNYLNKDSIKKSEINLTLEDMRNKKAILGIDLSSGGDLTSIGLVFNLDEGKKYIYSHSFIPEQKILQQEKSSLVPYRDWINRGLITTTAGFKTNYKVVLNHIKEIKEKYNIEILDTGYDPYGAGAWLDDLLNVVENATSITQSARNLGSTVEDFSLSMDDGDVLFDKNNDLLKWSMGNAKVEYNSFKEPKVIKERGADKIDPIISIIDAWYLVYNSKTNLDYNAEYEKWVMLFN